MTQSPLTAGARNTPDKASRAARGDERSAEILRAAEDVFLEQGYSNATTDDIAARAGASKATIYKLFGSKDALLEEIVRSRVPDIVDASSQALQTSGAIDAVLANWSLKVLKKVTEPRAVALFRLIWGESTRSPELARMFYDRGPATAQRHLADYFRHATAEGRLNCSDPQQASALFAAAVFGDGFERTHLGLAGDTWYEQKAKPYVKEAVAMFLARYGVRGQSDGAGKAG